MFAGVQPQAVVDLRPHPPRAVSPFQDDVGNVSRGQLLRDRQPGRSPSYYDYIEALNHQFRADFLEAVLRWFPGKP